MVLRSKAYVSCELSIELLLWQRKINFWLVLSWLCGSKQMYTLINTNKKWFCNPGRVPGNMKNIFQNFQDEGSSKKFLAKLQDVSVPPKNTILCHMNTCQNRSQGYFLWSILYRLTQQFCWQLPSFLPFLFEPQDRADIRLKIQSSIRYIILSWRKLQIHRRDRKRNK